jgi:hypothetical protein
VGLAWQVGEAFPEDPERELRRQRFMVRLTEAQGQGKEPTPEALGFSVVEWRQVMAEMVPLRPPDGVDSAREALEDLGLLAPVERGEGGSLHAVHRWTGSALV